MDKITGKVDWEEVDVGPEFPWMKIEQGDNKLRILTSPYQFWVHWSKDVSGQTARLNCCLKDCPECNRAKFKAEKRWVMAVLDRKSGKPHVMEVGKSIFRKIKNLVEDEEWGKPTQYDVNVKRGPKGQNPLYDVIAYSKKGLSDGEKNVAREFVKGLDFTRITEAMSPEQMLEKLGLGAPVSSSSSDQEGLDDTPSVGSSSVDDDFDAPPGKSANTGEEVTPDDDDLDFD